MKEPPPRFLWVTWQTNPKGMPMLEPFEAPWLARYQVDG